MYIRKSRSLLFFVDSPTPESESQVSFIKDDDQPKAANKIPKIEHVSEEEKLRLADNF